MDQQEMTTSQFGSNARNYLTSSVHASGADLVRLVDRVRERPSMRVLDLGCGAGHVAYALARGGARRVAACDPSVQMLQVVNQEAARLGYEKIETTVCSAEVLPFDSDSFDLVVTRYSAHHWADVPRALKECFRVTASTGRLIVIDIVAPETPLLDTSLQVMEFLRDASHVRDYRISEWLTMLKDAGFQETSRHHWKTAIAFQSWIQRIGTPGARVAALRSVLAELPREAQDYFEIATDGSFRMDSAWIESVRAG